MKIDYLPLQRITSMHADEIHEAVRRVIDGGWYLKGEATARFEAHYAQYIGTRHCIGVGNGLDALTLILRAYMEMGRLHEGDEVLVPANTFIATILAITECRLVPILVEPDINTFQIDETLIEQAITPRTRALMLVHLYGRCAYTPRIGEICSNHQLLLIEDNAQAAGCYLMDNGQWTMDNEKSGDNYQLSIINSPLPSRTGSLGHAAAHSFYPGKNLGALGDAGAVTTNDDDLAAVVRSIANYGSSRKYVFDYLGRNSRLDELQAAVLDVKLRYLDADNDRRRNIARRYISSISNPLLVLPSLLQGEREGDCVFHIFPVLCARRDALQQYLSANGVGTMIHYPIPPHKQKCYLEWISLQLPVTERIHREELSLPCHQAMTDEEVQIVIDLLCRFT